MEVSKLTYADKQLMVEGFKILFNFLSNPAVVEDINSNGYEIRYSQLTGDFLTLIGTPDTRAVGV